MKNYSVGLPVVLIAIFLCPFQGVQAAQDRFYVATDGNDAWSGRLSAANAKGTDGPFATVVRARDAIREIKTAGRFDRPLKVFIRDGLHFQTEPFVLQPEDSGTDVHPVTYTAFPGERPILSGGRRISGWKRGPGKLWIAQLPEVKAGKWSFRQLFVGDKRARRARMPNTGFYNLSGLIVPGDREAPVNRTGFRFQPGDIKADWTNLADVEVVKLFRWSETRMRVAAVDAARSVVTFTGRTGPNPRLFDWSGGRYYVENVKEGLDSPGEWYLDRKAGMLFYWPLPGEEPATAEIIAPVIGQLVRMEGDVVAGKFVEHIHFRGLTFAHSGWSLPETGLPETQSAVPILGQNTPEGYPAGTIFAEGARACVWEGNEVAHVGTHAIELSRACRKNRIARNRLHDLGAGGIKIGESIYPNSDQHIASGTIVCDNEISDCGHVNLGAVGIWLGQSSGNVIAHNEIHDLNYSGISMGWNWGCAANRTKNNVIEYNHIHHLMNLLDDGGGIYLLGVSPGTVVRNNLIHDIFGHGPLGRGIYLDQGSSGVRIENNVVYNTKNSFCAGSGNNVWENNIFAESTGRQIWYNSGRCSAVGARFVRNIVYYSNPSAALMSLYQIDTKEGIHEAVAESDYNLFFLAGGGKMSIHSFSSDRAVVQSFAEWQGLGYDRHSLVADPLFVNPRQGDFTLKPGSPALKLGFRPIDVSRVGPRGKR